MLPRTLSMALVAAVLSLCAVAPAGAQDEVPPDDDPLVAPAGACRGDDDPGAHHRTQRLALHCLLRYARRHAGLRTVRSSRALRHSAIYKARRIARCQVFTHHPCGDALAVPFRRAQLTRRGPWFVGEDLAWGIGQSATARTTLVKWLRSPSHRRVVLDGGFTHVGVRRRRLGMRGAPHGAVLWVAHLGRRTSAR